jgi:hypothetical protein
MTATSRMPPGERTPEAGIYLATDGDVPDRSIRTEESGMYSSRMRRMQRSMMAALLRLTLSGDTVGSFDCAAVFKQLQIEGQQARFRCFGVVLVAGQDAFADKDGLAGVDQISRLNDADIDRSAESNSSVRLFRRGAETRRSFRRTQRRDAGKAGVSIYTPVLRP